MVGCLLFRVCIIWDAFSGVPGRIQRMSSIYLFHIRGSSGRSLSSCSSSSAMNRFAYAGANLLPMAVPRIWWYICPAK